MQDIIKDLETLHQAGDILISDHAPAIAIQIQNAIENLSTHWASLRIVKRFLIDDDWLTFLETEVLGDEISNFHNFKMAIHSLFQEDPNEDS